MRPPASPLPRPRANERAGSCPGNAAVKLSGDAGILGLLHENSSSLTYHSKIETLSYSPASWGAGGSVPVNIHNQSIALSAFIEVLQIILSLFILATSHLVFSPSTLVLLHLVSAVGAERRTLRCFYTAFVS